MNQLFLSIIAFTGGIFLAVQGGLNSHLGVLTMIAGILLINLK